MFVCKSVTKQWERCNFLQSDMREAQISEHYNIKLVIYAITQIQKQGNVISGQ